MFSVIITDFSISVCKTKAAVWNKSLFKSGVILNILFVGNLGELALTYDYSRGVTSDLTTALNSLSSLETFFQKVCPFKNCPLNTGNS